MTATVHTQDVNASPFTLSQTDQIPFFFCAIPYHLIDSEVFPQLKGNHIKLLLVIDRYRNLKLKQRKFDQQLISGWTIPVSQQVLAAPDWPKTGQRSDEDALGQTVRAVLRPVEPANL